MDTEEEPNMDNDDVTVLLRENLDEAIFLFTTASIGVFLNVVVISCIVICR